MPDTAPAPETIEPISAAQSAALIEAAGAARRFSRAARFATWNGISLLLGAGSSTCLALFDPVLLLSAAVLLASGLIELRGAKLFRAFDLRAPHVLGANQLGLGLLIIGYAATRLYAIRSGELTLEALLASQPGVAQLLASVSDPNLVAMLGSLAGLYRFVLQLVYATLIAVAFVVQGGAAIYYLSRHRHLRAFLARTPAWVISSIQARQAGDR